MSETGADYGQDYVGSYQDENDDKNHNRGTTIPIQIQPGMLFSRSTDDRLTHHASAGQDYLVFQGNPVCMNNEVVCMNNEVVVMLPV